MSGLVGYGSSDDEENEEIEPISAASPKNDLREKEAKNASLTHANTTNAKIDGIQDSVPKTKVSHDSLVGPRVESSDQAGIEDGWITPSSPYSANRAAVRNLTMPLLPILDIPPSPTGSPPPEMEEKFERFLQLKKQGVHFNEKLAGSSALKNPTLFQKLLASAGLSESDQYATTLPESLWDPSAFPNHAYKEELASSQQRISKRKEEERLRTQRPKVDFIPAASPASSVRGDSMVSKFGSKGSKDNVQQRG